MSTIDYRLEPKEKDSKYQSFSTVFIADSASGNPIKSVVFFLNSPPPAKSLTYCITVLHLKKWRFIWLLFLSIRLNVLMVKATKLWARNILHTYDFTHTDNSIFTFPFCVKLLSNLLSNFTVDRMWILQTFWELVILCYGFPTHICFIWSFNKKYAVEACNLQAHGVIRYWSKFILYVNFLFNYTLLSLRNCSPVAITWIAWCLSDFFLVTASVKSSNLERRISIPVQKWCHTRITFGWCCNVFTSWWLVILIRK